MRESLFRGKRLDNEEWVSSGNLITFNDEGEEKQFFIPQMNAKCTCTHDEQDNIISFNSGMFCKVNPDTVGQFTGLTDKNGTKIFEGDIVKFTDSPFGISYTGEVVFHGGAFCIKYKSWASNSSYHRIGQTDKWQDMGASGEVTYSYEKLGNVHDNPELLGGAEDGN